MATPLDIAGAGKTLLALLQQQLESQGVEVPSSRFSMLPGGMFIEDRPGLTVMFAALTRGIGASPQPGPVLPSQLMQYVTFIATLVRPVGGVTGGGKPPSDARLTGDFDAIADDASNLWAALVSIHSARLIVPQTVPFMYGPLESIGPEGNMAGVRCPVSWQLTK